MWRLARDWPALMKPATARAYLDNPPAAAFNALVVPHLDARRIGSCLRFTWVSIDAWIASEGQGLQLQTPGQFARLLDADES